MIACYVTYRNWTINWQKISGLYKDTKGSEKHSLFIRFDRPYPFSVYNKNIIQKRPSKGISCLVTHCSQACTSTSTFAR